MPGDRSREYGACRVNRQSIYAFLGYADPDQQLAYKKLLVRADLLRGGWEDTIRRGSHSAMYHLTDGARASFGQWCRTQREQQAG